MSQGGEGEYFFITPTQLFQVKQAVLDSLLDLLPEQTSKKRMSSCTLKEAYVSKMVKVNDSDRWSLIALGNNLLQKSINALQSSSDAPLLWAKKTLSQKNMRMPFPNQSFLTAPPGGETKLFKATNIVAGNG